MLPTIHNLTSPRDKIITFALIKGRILSAFVMQKHLDKYVAVKFCERNLLHDGSKINSQVLSFIQGTTFTFIFCSDNRWPKDKKSEKKIKKPEHIIYNIKIELDL
jgi:hypothetical protein